MKRHWLFVILLFSSIAIATASFAAGENSGVGGEHNGTSHVNCGEDSGLPGDEC